MATECPCCGKWLYAGEKTTVAACREREPHPITGQTAMVERLQAFCNADCLAVYRKNQESNHA